MINIIKAKTDKRVYLYNKLPNFIKCLLIHDSDADKSAAALNVNIGSLFDPKEYQGLAHFCEHMLFMGTTKYPQENDFSEFLNKNSGYSNAYTDLDSTNYYFEVNNENFIPALDRFAQFFTSPLFNVSAVEREVQAVDSENKKNLQSDMWRTMQLIRSEANSDSIFNRFATGNLQTLNKPKVRDALLDFHSKYYSSHVMSLVLISNLPIEELNKTASELFSAVPLNKEIDKYLYQANEKAYQTNTHFNFIDFKKVDNTSAYDKRNCGNLYHYVPVKDQDEIHLYWFFDENYNLHYKEKPIEYLSSVLGHEGPFSLTSSLIKDDLITSLTCGGYTYANTFTSFYFKISLTKKGLSRTEDVISRIFDAINNLKQKPINKRYFEELKEINYIKFNYKNKEEPTDYVSDLANRFTTKPPEHILVGDYYADAFDENLIKKTLMQLTLDNLNIFLCSREYENKCTLTEEWYGTKYSKEKIPENLANAFINGSRTKYSHILDYPPQNKFIATKFELKALDPQNNKKYPQLLEKNETHEVWFKQDNVFLLPKAIIYLQLYLKKDFLPNADYAVISEIWKNLIQNELQEIIYMASEASIHIDFRFNLEGLIITIQGFNSALKASTEEILRKFKETLQNLNEKLTNYYSFLGYSHKKHNIDGENMNNNNKNVEEKTSFFDLLEKIKSKIEEAEQDNTNFYLGNPYIQVLRNLDIFLRNTSQDHESKLKSVFRLKKLAGENNLYQFWHFLNCFLTETKYEWLIQGNLEKEEALEIVNNTEKLLSLENLPSKDLHSDKIANISHKQNFYFTHLSNDSNNLNSSIISYFQAGNLNNKENCILMLIEFLFREKFFDDLRTKQALGYIVRLGLREHRDINGVFCLVQSSVRSPEYLQNVITEFLSNIKWEEFDEETYSQYVNAVIVELKKKDLKLEEEVLRNFSEIQSKNYLFSRNEEYVEILKTLKIEEVKKFFNKLFFEQVKRLDIGLLAHCHSEENEKLEQENLKQAEEISIQRIKVHSANEFKKNVGHYPDFYSAVLKGSGAKF